MDYSAASDWYGKRPGPHVAPLTPEWYTAATQPHYHQDGSITYTLTPPRGYRGPWLTVLGVLWFLAACVAAATYGIWWVR